MHKKYIEKLFVGSLMAGYHYSESRRYSKPALLFAYNRIAALRRFYLIRLNK